MALELRSRLQKVLGLAEALSASMVFDYPTIEAAAGYLEGVLFPVSDRPAEAEGGKGGGAALAESIAAMSEAEAEALLRRKLASYPALSR
jgi:polyketide synthase 12/polyene macrolide polyketide synthase/epothilone polyketide synthase D